MSVDLMDLVRKSVPRVARDGLGERLGMSADQAFHRFESAAGLIVGGLKAKSKTADGASEIFKTARDQDFGLLDRFGSIVTDEAKVEDLQSAGSIILKSLFGANLSQVLGAFSQSSGLDEDGASSFLKLAAPIVMGNLGKIVGKQSLNVAGMASVLSVQPDHIPTPVPTTATAGDSESAGPSMKLASGSPEKKISSASDEPETIGGSIIKYVIAFCFGAIAVLGSLYYVDQWSSPGDGSRESDSAVVPQESAGVSDSNRAFSEAPNRVAPTEGFDLEKVLEKFGSIAAGLKDLNEENAPAIAEKLTGLSESIDGWGLDRLKGLSRNLFSIAVKNFRSELNRMVEKHRDDRIISVIKPAIQKLEDKLAEHGF